MSLEMSEERSHLRQGPLCNEVTAGIILKGFSQQRKDFSDFYNKKELVKIQP
jgi:hypothetical protein